jgi:hypothetical protein
MLIVVTIVFCPAETAVAGDARQVRRGRRGAVDDGARRRLRSRAALPLFCPCGDAPYDYGCMNEGDSCDGVAL